MDDVRFLVLMFKTANRKIIRDTVFQSFVQRGLFGVKLVISDAHKGLVKAVRKNFF
ncbi:transposase [Enterococcus faecium]|uniref:transposase n=1 Tax=Enterococcus faecium TaxID=1352 RepID=UPI0039E34AAA